MQMIPTFLQHNNTNNLYDLQESPVHNISNWLAANKLTLNANKIKCVLFRSKKKNATSYDKPLFFDKSQLEQEENIMFLGLNLNENLLLKFYMLRLMKKLRSYIGIIFKLQLYLNTENLIFKYIIHFLKSPSLWHHHLESWKQNHSRQIAKTV